MKITVYTTPNCVQCQTTKRQLDKMNLPYNVIDLSTDPDSMDLVKSLGYTQAPVVVVTEGDNTKSWAGFRMSKLQQLVH
jgi:glutaredoxin-like protein NrdH